MTIAITIVHVIVCVFLILVVLLQTGKGAEMGAVFGGGGSSTIFGASGAGNFLTKLTTASAIIFFLTSLFLAWSSLSHTRATVFDTELPAPPPRSESQDAPPPVSAEPPAPEAESPPTAEDAAPRAAESAPPPAANP